MKTPNWRCNGNKLLYKKKYEILLDLKGLIFRPRDKKALVGDFHFDKQEDDDEGSAPVPFISFVDAMAQDHEQWYLSDNFSFYLLQLHMQSYLHLRV
jgi:hypothetical protein